MSESSKKTNRPITVVACMLTTFMAAVEMTVVSTAMPTVAGDLGGIHLYAAVFTAYMLTSTVTVPVYGRLADMHGRKPVLLFGLALFLLGSVLSGAATTMPQLVAFRALQGLGAGAMQPVTITIVGDIFSAQERARLQGLFAGTWGFAGLAGPAIGGLLVKYASWRWIFYINVPFGLLAAVMLVAGLHESIEKKKPRFDVLGAVLIVTSLVALLFAAQREAYAWLELAIALVAGTAFVVVELRTPEPLVSLTLFRNRVLAVSSIAGTLVGASMISIITYVSLYVQGVLGKDATEAASAITLMVVGWPVASVVSGWLLPRVGFRPLVVGGLFVSAVATVLLAALLHPDSPVAVVRFTTMMFGVGMGFANTSLVIAVQSSVPWNQRGVATASTMFFRGIGGTLALGALGGLLTHAVTANPAIPEEAVNRFLGPQHGRGVAPEILAALGPALASALGTILWVVAALAVLGFLTSLFFPRLTLGPTSPSGTENQAEATSS